MPELPEVETVKRSLEPLLIGKKIESVSVLAETLIKDPKDIQVFKELIKDKTIISLERRGKYLLINLESDYLLVVHLRMTGKLLHMPSENPIEKHSHVLFHLSDGFDLRFNDMRRFGVIHLIKNDEIEKVGGLYKIGLEPLSPDLNAESLEKMLKNKKQKLKAFLLDQHFIAGIGNIYADEILFRARLNPEERVNNLSKDDLNNLVEAIKEKIALGIECGGATIKDYVDGLGNTGKFQNHLQMYGKAGEDCSVCKNKIEKTKVAGRSTSFCPQCQKLKEI